MGIALTAGLGLWIFQRVGEARSAKSAVEARRTADTERSATLAKEPMRVRVVSGAAESWQARVELDGTLQAQHDASLGFKVSGRLSQVNVEVGDRVRAGTVLGRLDELEARAQASVATAQARAASASLALAVDNEERTLPLVKNGSVPAASGVQASQQRELAQAQLESAQAQAALAKAGLSNHVSLAPFSGTITQAPTGIGAVVGPGQTLFRLVDTSTLKLNTTVIEEDANLLAPGSEVRVSSAQGELTGRVTAVLATLDPATRRVPIVAEFDNAGKKGSDSPLRAGAFVRAWVASDRAVPVLRLPHAILRPGSQDEVFAVDPTNQRLQSRRISFSTAPTGELLVRSGLSAADQVVLDPIIETKAGDEVRIDPSAEGGPEALPQPKVPSAEAPTAPASVAEKASTP